MAIARLYAELLLKVLAGKSSREQEKRLEHFLSLVHSRGHGKLLPRIVREFEKVLARASRKAEVTLTAAHEKDLRAAAKEAAAVLARAGREGTPLRERVDQRLVRGFVLAGSDFTYDASARASLIALFERLTAH